MPRTPEQQQGLDFEARVNEALGLRATPASGNRWDRRGDGAGRGLRMSAKSNPTTKRTWSQTRREMAEAVDMAAGTGDVPVLAIEDEDGATFLLMRLPDAPAVLGSGGQVIERLGQRNRRRASQPVLLREDGAA